MAAFLLLERPSKTLGHLWYKSLVRQHDIDIVLLVEYAFGEKLPSYPAHDGRPTEKLPSPKRFGVFRRGNQHISRLRAITSAVALAFWRWVPPPVKKGWSFWFTAWTAAITTTARAGFSLAALPMLLGGAKACGVISGRLLWVTLIAQPFESAIADADGLHAIGVRTVQGRSSRTVRGAGAAAEFFYNPMWRTYGHQQQHPEAGAATHYWTGSWAAEVGLVHAGSGCVAPPASRPASRRPNSASSRKSAIFLSLTFKGCRTRRSPPITCRSYFTWNL